MDPDESQLMPVLDEPDNKFREPLFALKVGTCSWFCIWNQSTSKPESLHGVSGEGTSLEEHCLLANEIDVPTNKTQDVHQSSIRIRTLVACAGLALTVGVIGSVMTGHQIHFYWHNVEQLCAGLATLYATIRSGLHIYEHVKMNPSELKRCIVRILIIVPIYAINSWTCLLVESNPSNVAQLITFSREMWEAVAVCSFMQFIFTIVDGPRMLAQKLLEGGQNPVHHPWPLSLMIPTYRPGPHFVARVAVGVLQYVVVAPCLFVVNFFIWGCLLDEDLQHFRKGLLRIEVLPGLLKAVSCGWALYNLLLLYKESHCFFEHVNPVMKFLAIKAIIFFTFWQGFCVEVLPAFNLIPDHRKDLSSHEWSQQQIVDGLKNFLLSMEMPIFSEIHRCAYPITDDYTDVEEIHHDNTQDSFGLFIEREMSRGQRVDLHVQDVSKLLGDVRKLLHEATPTPPV